MTCDSLRMRSEIRRGPGTAHPSRRPARGPWASAPRPVGSHLAVNEDGLFAGSVSGGCVEGEVIEHARDVMQRGFPRVLEFGVSDDRAWEVGLACGGAIQVYVERVE